VILIWQTYHFSEFNRNRWWNLFLGSFPWSFYCLGCILIQQFPQSLLVPSSGRLSESWPRAAYNWHDFHTPFWATACMGDIIVELGGCIVGTYKAVDEVADETATSGVRDGLLEVCVKQQMGGNRKRVWISCRRCVCDGRWATGHGVHCWKRAMVGGGVGMISATKGGGVPRESKIWLKKCEYVRSMIIIDNLCTWGVSKTVLHGRCDFLYKLWSVQMSVASAAMRGKNIRRLMYLVSFQMLPTSLGMFPRLVNVDWFRIWVCCGWERRWQREFKQCEISEHWSCDNYIIYISNSVSVSAILHRHRQPASIASSSP